jgi:hypothetical protein
VSWCGAMKHIQVNTLEDTDIEADEDFLVTLGSLAGSQISTASLTVTLTDNDRLNTAPTVSAGENREVNGGATVTLTAQATDAENDAISYAWQQTSGESVTLSNANTASAQFVAPAMDASLVFTVTATDALQSSTQASVTITVKAAVVALPEVKVVEPSSGGGSLGSLSLLLLAGLGIRRRCNKIAA